MTIVKNISENTAPGLQLDQPEVLSNPRSTERDAGTAQRPGALTYKQFHTAELGAARRFFASAYKPGWRINELSKDVAVVHRRCEARSMMLDELLIQGRVECEISADEFVYVIQPRAGSLSVMDEPFPSPDYPLLVADGTPCLLDVNVARFDVVSIGANVLHKVAAAEQRSPLPPQIRFLTCYPRSLSAARAWHRALAYVTSAFASTETAQLPLIAAAAAPLLAAALLDCYPSNATAEQNLLNDPEVPQALKDAVSFIHCHVSEGVGINDVAEAVHLTPRAVQYLFRQKLNTTPTEYLRRIRLHRAHRDLVAGDRMDTTVAEISQRWGFAHTGRFAVLYRQTYGLSPHTTLKQ